MLTKFDKKSWKCHFQLSVERVISVGFWCVSTHWNQYDIAFQVKKENFEKSQYFSQKVIFHVIEQFSEISCKILEITIFYKNWCKIHNFGWIFTFEHSIEAYWCALSTYEKKLDENDLIHVKKIILLGEPIFEKFNFEENDHPS